MRIDRRSLLIGAGAIGGGLVIGIAGERAGWWEADILGAADPEDVIARTARRREAALIKAYDTALGSGSADPRLTAYRQHHVDHLSALGGSERDAADVPEQTVPAEPAALPAYFGEQEQAWARDAATGVRITPDGGQARLLSLIAASETMHVRRWTGG